MKGLVFTEFIEMVESSFGFEVADEIIQNANLPSNGVYTAVGTYPHQEIVALVVELHKVSKIEIPDLLKTFGRYLFQRFTVAYPLFFKNASGAFDFLTNIEGYIHVEVKKLYPEAELPKIKTEMKGDNEMVMIYLSERKMSDLAVGLIEGCAEYFKENITIKTELVDKEGSQVRFILTK